MGLFKPLVILQICQGCICTLGKKGLNSKPVFSLVIKDADRYFTRWYMSKTTRVSRSTSDQAPHQGTNCVKHNTRTSILKVEHKLLVNHADRDAVQRKLQSEVSVFVFLFSPLPSSRTLCHFLSLELLCRSAYLTLHRSLFLHI